MWLLSIRDLHRIDKDSFEMGEIYECIGPSPN